MKKLVFEYLTQKNPNIYLVKTKFGDLVRGFDETLWWLDVKRELVSDVMNLFCCDLLTAEEFVKEWTNNRPWVDNISCTSSGPIFESSFTTTQSLIINYI